MKKNDYLVKYSELINEISLKEADLKLKIQDYLDGKSTISKMILEQTIIRTNDTINQLKLEAEKSIEKYKIVCQEEKLKEKQLASVQTLKILMKSRNFENDYYTIENENLIVNSEERDVSKEELEFSRQLTLSILRDKVANQGISLDSAKKLRDDIEIAYYVSLDETNEKQK